MGAIRYSSPIWLVPTYILPAKDINGTSDADQEYIYFMELNNSPQIEASAQKRFLLPVTYFPVTYFLVYPFTLRVTGILITGRRKPFRPIKTLKP